MMRPGPLSVSGKLTDRTESMRAVPWLLCGLIAPALLLPACGH
jgi:hypothetical protein